MKYLRGDPVPIDAAGPKDPEEPDEI
jgi:hypothetical protein